MRESLGGRPTEFSSPEKGIPFGIYHMSHEEKHRRADPWPAERRYGAGGIMDTDHDSGIHGSFSGSSHDHMDDHREDIGGSKKGWKRRRYILRWGTSYA